jgi:hypothetical protein
VALPASSAVIDSADQMLGQNSADVATLSCFFLPGWPTSHVCCPCFHFGEELAGVNNHAWSVGGESQTTQNQLSHIPGRKSYVRIHLVGMQHFVWNAQFCSSTKTHCHVSRNWENVVFFPYIF